MCNNNNDDFADGMIAAVVMGFAAYGAVKLYQQVTKTPEQRMLDSLGRELRAIDTHYADNAGQDSFDEFEEFDDEG